MPVITRVNNILEVEQYLDYIESPWGTVLAQTYFQADYCRQIDALKNVLIGCCANIMKFILKFRKNIQN